MVLDDCQHQCQYLCVCDFLLLFVFTEFQATGQNRDWGLSFLFKLGISLEQGHVTEQDGDDRIGKAIVDEFSHFNDITTWTWNEEVVQKDPLQSIDEMYFEDVVASSSSSCSGADQSQLQRRGQKQALSDSSKKGLFSAYESYDREYDVIFKKYIDPESDRSEIVDDVISRAAALRPCRADNWNDRVVAEIPLILAGVFAYFTIIKSGESFNRLEISEGNAGDPRLLM